MNKDERLLCSGAMVPHGRWSSDLVQLFIDYDGVQFCIQPPSFIGIAFVPINNAVQCPGSTGMLFFL